MPETLEQITDTAIKAIEIGMSNEVIIKLTGFTDREIIKAKNFIVQSNVAHSYIKIKDLKNREPMYG